MVFVLSGLLWRNAYIEFCEISPSRSIRVVLYLKTRTDGSDYLFVTERKPIRPLTKCAVEKVFRLLSERSGINKHITPHVLRHTTATQAINNGMAIEDISKLLGHASVATTMIYAKVSNTRVQSEHLRCVI